MADKSKEFKLWIPLVLFFSNHVLITFLIAELVDATEPNSGILGFLTPILALISFFYIRRFGRQNHGSLVRFLQWLNWLFIIFPIIVCVYIMFAFI